MTKAAASDRYELLRSKLVQARKDAGLTQIEVANKLGRTQAYVSKYELGRRRLDVIEFFEVAEAIGFNPIMLLRKLHVELSKK